MSKSQSNKERNAQATRQMILEVTAGILHREGYQGMRIDEVVKQTGLTKGAIYHHFPNKKALSYAVFDEYLTLQFLQIWVQSLRNTNDPIQVMIEIIQGLSVELSEEQLALGCPICNLGQEMSPLDEGFRERVEGLMTTWMDVLVNAFRGGIEAGNVQSSTSAEDIALFIVASMQGVITMGKCTQDINKVKSCMRVFIRFLESLRP